MNAYTEHLFLLYQDLLLPRFGRTAGAVAAANHSLASSLCPAHAAAIRSVPCVTHFVYFAAPHV